MGFGGQTVAAENYEDFYDENGLRLNTPKGHDDDEFPMHPDPHDRLESDFLKSLTAEYLSTIKSSTEFWKSRRELRRTLHPKMSEKALPKEEVKRPKIKIKVNSQHYCGFNKRFN
jgi:hypothetical protein